MNNLIKVGSAVPKVIVGNVKENVKNILALISEAHEQGCKFVVFPELCVTGYTCGDLFRTSKLLHEAKEGVNEITRNMPSGIIAIVGSPNVYNSAFIVGRDHYWVVNKTYLPSYNEFYEGRWFKESEEEPQVFQAFGVKFGVEICEDLWAPLPPSTKLVQGGAEIIFNLSASNELIGKHEYLKSLVSQQSGRLICGYVYSSAGYGESTQDLVYPGKSLIAENGKLLVDKCGTSGLSVADIDLDIIRHDRLVNTSFRKFIQPNKDIKQLYVGELNVENPIRKYKSKVFSVKNKAEYEKIKDIQVQALMTRLEHTGLDPVIGISGGSDSTWALLICYEAIKKLGRGKIIGITMPGFATSQRTKSNSLALMTALGIEPREIDIRNICKAELEALGHDLTTQDITYENVQARTRTQILMNVSNQEHGLVIGTGDLSELALGWCTYNADHMSMYGINVSVPKTLIKNLIRSYAEYETEISEELKNTLIDVIETPVSPELTGSGAEGEDAQVTEDKIGPYELHDFFLYYYLRYGFSEEKILFVAEHSDLIQKYDIETIEKWLGVFMKRFYSQQFKRSCLPDGPKIGSISLSPRGDLRMPSDIKY